MKRVIRFLPCMLVMLALCACAGDEAPGTQQGFMEGVQNAVGALVNGGAPTSKDFLEGVQNVAYTLANEETVKTNTDGYAATTVAKTWVGMRGETVPTLHPGGEVAIPAQKTTDLIIPFALTVTCDTEDTSFVTDISVVSASIWREQPGNSWSSHRFRATDAEEIDRMQAIHIEWWERAKENDNPLPELTRVWEEVWNSDGHIRYYKAAEKGDEHIVYGYYVLKEYYSPAHPDGNDEMIPTDENFGIALKVFTGTNRGNEIGTYLSGGGAMEPDISIYDAFLAFKTR